MNTQEPAKIEVFTFKDGPSDQTPLKFAPALDLREFGRLATGQVSLPFPPLPGNSR